MLRKSAEDCRQHERETSRKKEGETDRCILVQGEREKNKEGIHEEEKEKKKEEEEEEDVMVPERDESPLLPR